MVIHYAKKIIFIGIPFSASSAISKELLDNYGFEPLFHKHSNIPLLRIKRPDINLKEYTIAAVKRDPLDVTFTAYNKAKTNAHNAFTDPTHFVENGGYVTKRARKIYHQLQKNNWTFEEYVRNVYRFKPYDNYLSYNKPYINFSIDARNINTDFQKLLKQNNIESIRDLPSYNKTKRIVEKPNLTSKTLQSAFGSFIIFNKMSNYQLRINDIGYFNYLKFHILRVMRNQYWLLRDLKCSKNEIFTVD